MADLETRMSRVRQSTKVAQLALLVGALGVLAGCKVTQDFRQALDQFQAGEQGTAATEIGEAEGLAPEVDTNAAQAAPQEPATRDLVLAAQKLLAQMGYEPGPVDGLPGKKTRRAVRKFQRDIGTPVDGAVTSSLVLALVNANENGIIASASTSPDGEPRPVYVPGDTYVYSDSTSATVVRVENDVIIWESGDGERGASHWNFVRPGAAAPFARPRVRYEVEVAADELWPLRSGTSVSFTARRNIAQASVGSGDAPSTQAWQCSVAGSEAVTVAAGRFDTVRIACQTSTPVNGEAVERTWFYAPELRHFVRFDERFEASRPVNSVELVAVKLKGIDWPPAARAGLQRALQAALESAPKGERIEWKSSAVDTRVTITPTAAHQDTSSYCRTFVQNVEVPGEAARLYPGVACRETSGAWVIPGASQS